MDEARIPSSDDKKPATYTLLYPSDEIKTTSGYRTFGNLRKFEKEMMKEARKFLGSFRKNGGKGGSKLEKFETIKDNYLLPPDLAISQNL